MARIIGTSDAWKSVCLDLNRINLKPDKPSDIHKFLKTAEEEYAQAKAKAIKDLQNKIETIKQDIERREKNFDADIQRGKNNLIERIESTNIKLQSLQSGFAQKIFNYFKIRKQKGLIRRLNYKHDNLTMLAQRKINQTKDDLEKTQNNIDTLIDKETQTLARKVRLIEKILKSPELAGGIAELELIENLKSLPDNCFIINDVLLELRRAIHFDGDWLKSAQIDHVVVTPSGIFVVEVKNWSKRFTQEGNYFNPYQQVKRASYLCYKLIGEKYNLQTKSIVAYKGSIPEKPSYSYAKVLPLNEVKGYISWFKEPIVSDQVVEKIVQWLANTHTGI